MNKLTDTIKLANGVGIPCIGYGTWQTPDGETAVKSVKEAIKCGYTHIDTAAIYGNEVSVGQGIAESGVEREKLFVTSKVWTQSRGYEKTLKAFEKTTSDLGLDYLDLYLIHWPAAPQHGEGWEEENLSTWRAMEELYKAGKIRAIGVSNFLVHHLEPLMAAAEIKPMVNQIELHIGYNQSEICEYCKKNGIVLEAWAPIGTGRLFGHKPVEEMAAKYGKSVAQLAIRWCIQNDFLPLPKTVTPSRMAENADVFDFEISAEDMAYLNGMESFGWSGEHPDTFAL